MGARDKINGMFGLGIAALSGFIGLAYHSWTVFLVVAAVLMGASIVSGDIRVAKNRRRRK